MVPRVGPSIRNIYTMNAKATRATISRSFAHKASLARRHRVLEEGDVSEKVVAAQYAVRGPIAVKSDELRKRLRHNPSTLPFDQVFNMNIGNPQQLDQQPLTFLRQVVALTEYPALLDEDKIETTSKLFAPDAMQRARQLLSEIGSTGAYSASQGIPSVCESVARFIERRDGPDAGPASAKNIFLLSGASSGVHHLLDLLIAGPQDGVMVPVPQYPLYSAALSTHGGHMVPYYLDESAEWSVDLSELHRSIREARERDVRVRAIVVINPGNPTGSVLNRESMESLLHFARQEGLVLIADEVYQTNVFPGVEWQSFRRVLHEMRRSGYDRDWDTLELASLQTISKGQIGECGRRGGYVELTNFSDFALEQFYKLASINLCPPVSGQIALDVMMRPPQPGDASYEQHMRELAVIQETMESRARALHAAFKRMRGVTCNEPEGAMYLFPRIHVPVGMEEDAYDRGIQVDELYCLELLERTGICVIPASGFGKMPFGRQGFRTTFLTGGDDFVDRLVNGHNQLLSDYDN